MTEYTSKQIAEAIMRDEEYRRTNQTGQIVPAIRPIPNTPATGANAFMRGYLNNMNPDEDWQGVQTRIWKQLLGTGGGDT
jgi:hypothetical protein